ncbi:MAG: glycosyltransferase family 4 protein [Pyrinomonadaceae bacterium]
MDANKQRRSEMRDAPLRVLLVGPSFDIVGGQSVQAARLLARLKEEPSLDVSFLPINPRAPGFLAKLQAIKYVRTVITSLLYVIALLARIPRCDVIHIFSASYFSFVLAPTPAIIISKLYGKKIVLDYHSGNAEDHLRRWRRTAIPTLRLVDRITVQTKYLAEVFARFGLRATPIFNLIETEQFHFRERLSLRPAFMTNRSFEAHYNVACVLRAFARVQREIPSASLMVAGDGALRAELEALAGELALRNTQFVGTIAPEQMPALYDAADIFLNGSSVDNMPLSILEAYAAGVPVVTTNAGGIPFIVTHEETGLMVECDQPEAMAACALRLLNNHTLAHKLARQAREECRKYGWDAVRHEWLRLYYDASAQEGEKTLRSKFVAGEKETAGKS